MVTLYFTSTCLNTLRVDHQDDPAAALARIKGARVDPEHADALGVVLLKELPDVQRESTLVISRFPEERIFKSHKSMYLALVLDLQIKARTTENRISKA